MPTTVAYLVVFAIAVATTFAITPVMRQVAIRTGTVDMPKDRGVHDQPMPYLGGVAMLIGFLVALGAAWVSGRFSVMFDGLTAPLGVALGAVILCAVGTLDDVRDVSAPAKTAGMVFAGSVMYLLGVTLLYFRLPLVDTLLVLGPDLAPLFTVLWVLGMANALNLIDGLDGLAAGIVFVAAGSFFLYGHRLATASEPILQPENPSPLIAIITAGICLGFLPHNFNPARIFMGDGGALMLGGLMASATVLVGGQTTTPSSGQVFFFFAPLFIPFFVMGVPIFDTALAIVRRARRGISPDNADKDHIHHRLMRLGHGQRRAVAILWLWTALLSAFILYPVYTGKGDGVVPLAVLALILMLLTFFWPNRRRVQREDAEAEVARARAIEEEISGGTPVVDATVDGAGTEAVADADADPPTDPPEWLHTGQVAQVGERTLVGRHQSGPVPVIERPATTPEAPAADQRPGPPTAAGDRARTGARPSRADAWRARRPHRHPPSDDGDPPG